MLSFMLVQRQGVVLAELAEKDPRIVILTEDMSPIMPFSERFPDRAFEVGISEANLIGVAAGLSQAGKIPFVFGMACFVSMRGFEQLRTCCSYNRNSVKILAPGGGLEGGHWGATHHAVEDLALLRTIPGMTILCPADAGDTGLMVRAAVDIDGPVYIRCGNTSRLEGYTPSFELGKAPVLREGDDLALLATGPSVAQALAAHDLLKAEGIHARVLNMNSIKPLDEVAVRKAAEETGYVVTVEEHFRTGGLGGAVAEVMAGVGAGRLLRLGLDDAFIMDVAPYPEILELAGLDPESVAKSAKDFVKG